VSSIPDWLPSPATAVETETPLLLAAVHDNVGVMSFNRPERRNALADEMYYGIDHALAHFSADDEVHTVMLTGEGGAFNAGSDVKAMNQSNQTGEPRAGRPASGPEQVAYLADRQRATSLAMWEYSKPIVAAIPGPAAGAGLSLALATDIRLAHEQAIFVTAFANAGASGDFGGSWFLTQLLGPSKAKELYFLSPRLSAQEALDLGLVNQVLPAADPQAFQLDALEWCRALGRRAPLAMTRMKQNINRAVLVDLATALDREAEDMVWTMGTSDHREAAAAFVEKRPPNFTGE